MKPSVSCIMPTHGRFPEYQHLVEEAVESFLRQDLPAEQRELVILNDCAGQELTMEGANVWAWERNSPMEVAVGDPRLPKVRIFNLPQRIPSLGEKYNHLVQLARHDIIAPWEDDDISLQNRLSLSLRRLGNNEYFNPKAYWYLERQPGKVPCGSRMCWSERGPDQKTWTFLLQHEQMTGVAHNCSVFTRGAWIRAGRYPRDCRQDAGMDSRLRAKGGVVDGPLSPHESFFIYRWGVGQHLSGNTDPELAYRLAGETRIPRGRFTIKPHWTRDYSMMAIAGLRRLEEPPPQPIINPTSGSSWGKMGDS